MSDKDPFAEPDDEDRTIIRPNPGGRGAVPTKSKQEEKFETQATSQSIEPEAQAIYEVKRRAN